MNREQLITELTFKAVRSSGAGGQNVNKVASKVVLTFDIPKSQGLSEEEKKTISYQSQFAINFRKPFNFKLR